MKLIIYLGGIYNLLFALFHIGFWKMLKWNEELKKLDFGNGEIMQMLNVHIIYYLFFTAFICIAFPSELLNTKLGNAFLLGCSLFWLLRTVQQFIFFPVGLGTIFLTVLFLIGIVLFALPVLKR